MNIDKLIAVLQASKQEGAVVESKYKNIADDWEEVPSPKWNFNGFYYRVRIPGKVVGKPRFKSVSELPRLFALRAPNGVDQAYLGKDWYDHQLKDITKNFLFSIDYRQWLPCWIEDREPEIIVSTEEE